MIKSDEGVTCITNQENVQSTKEIAIKEDNSLTVDGIEFNRRSMVNIDTYNYQAQLLYDLRMEQQETM